MKTSKKPEILEIRATNLDRNDYTEGRIIYFYSERRKVQPKSHSYQKKLLANGYHHLKGQDLRKGTMMYVRNARVVVEVFEYRSPRVKIYQTDITSQLKKLIGESASPKAVEILANRIACKKVAVYLAEGEVSVAKTKV